MVKNCADCEQLAKRRKEADKVIGAVGRLVEFFVNVAVGFAKSLAGVCAILVAGFLWYAGAKAGHEETVRPFVLLTILAGVMAIWDVTSHVEEGD